jgi:hypothetical protein
MLPPVSLVRTAGGPKPDLKAIVKAGVLGHPIELQASDDYLSLFHVMDRMGVFGAYRLLRTRVGPARWLAFIVPVRKYRAMQARARGSHRD